MEGLKYYKQIPLMRRILVKQIAESKAITMTGERVQSMKEMSGLLAKIIEFCSKVPTYDKGLNELLENTFKVHKHIIYVNRKHKINIRKRLTVTAS